MLNRIVYDYYNLCILIIISQIMEYLFYKIMVECFSTFSVCPKECSCQKEDTSITPGKY